jgi:hypothetical protein
MDSRRVLRRSLRRRSGPPRGRHHNRGSGQLRGSRRSSTRCRSADVSHRRRAPTRRDGQDGKPHERLHQLDGLLVLERVGSAFAGRLDVELLQNLNGEAQVPGRENFVGALGLVLLLWISRDRIEQNFGVNEPHGRGFRRDSSGRALGSGGPRSGPASASPRAGRTPSPVRKASSRTRKRARSRTCRAQRPEFELDGRRRRTMRP